MSDKKDYVNSQIILKRTPPHYPRGAKISTERKKIKTGRTIDLGREH
jgi:hypothetical protein